MLCNLRLISDIILSQRNKIRLLLPQRYRAAVSMHIFCSCLDHHTGTLMYAWHGREIIASEIIKVERLVQSSCSWIGVGRGRRRLEPLAHLVQNRETWRC